VKKTIGFIIAGILVGGGLVAALLLAPLPQANQPSDTSSNTSPETTPDRTETAAAGRYVTYEEGLVASVGYDETILFFYANWCPECRAFDQVLAGSEIPEGVQILKVDYDAADDLKTRHQVTLQSTFVRVDADGAQISKWVGYGKDKSLAAIRENT
jgi:hypothetical protein